MAAPIVRRLAAIRCKPPHFFANYPRVSGKCVDTNVTRAATCVVKMDVLQQDTLRCSSFATRLTK